MKAQTTDARTTGGAANAGTPDLVLGVAGHIDHGKTALVKALTGTDTDRLPEEKSRGITIELGFAHFALPGGRRAAVVDMPGHERFVRAMIAGAGGVDLLLLVVASNEGVMPQTREHLAVAGLVGVRAGVVALSKCELASPELLELASEEVREVLAGTPLERAEIVPVSAHTGAGLDALRAAIARAAVPARGDDGPTLMPVDRVFVRKGFGAVVTGTLVSGRVREGDALVLGPVGPESKLESVRVRGLQVHGAPVTEARAGTRLAVNLAGVEASEIPRGTWLSREGEVACTSSFDAQVRWLAGTKKPMGRRAKLELAVGAAHTEAVVALLEGEALEPGGEALARVTTEDPVLLRPGERFVLRGPPSLAGYGSTVGGGVAVRPRAERARKRTVALARAEAARDHAGEPEERARQEAETAAARGLSALELRTRAGFEARSDDPKGLEGAGLVAVERDRFVAKGAFDAAARKVLAALSEFHGAQPAAQGVGLRELEAVVKLDRALFDAALAALVRDKKAAREADRVCRAGWKARDPDALPHLRAVIEALRKSGVMPPRVQDIAAEQKVEPKALEPALKRLVEKGDAVKVSPELYADAAAMRELEGRLRAWLAEKGTIDAQGFKELTGASRKWSVPISEYFDAKKVTVRVGDARRLRG